MFAGRVWTQLNRLAMPALYVCAFAVLGAVVFSARYSVGDAEGAPKVQVVGTATQTPARTAIPPREAGGSARLEPVPGDVLFDAEEETFYKFTLHTDLPRGVQIWFNPDFESGLEPQVLDFWHGVGEPPADRTVCPAEKNSRTTRYDGNEIWIEVCSGDFTSIVLVDAANGDVVREYLVDSTPPTPTPTATHTPSPTATATPIPLPAGFPSVEVCVRRSVVPSQEPGLVGDCRVLLSAIGSMVGVDGGAPDWSGTLPIMSWEGVTVAESRVQKLRLNDVGLKGTLDYDMSRLDTLRVLDLSGNALGGDLPVWLGDMTALQNISLAGNDLTGHIPSEWRALVRLRRLNLADNDISGRIPVWIDEWEGLQILWLGKNVLSGALPSSMGGMTSLRYLYLSENDLIGDITPLHSLVDLKHLMVDGNSAL